MFDILFSYENPGKVKNKICQFKKILNVTETPPPSWPSVGIEPCIRIIVGFIVPCGSDLVIGGCEAN